MKKLWGSNKIDIINAGIEKNKKKNIVKKIRLPKIFSTIRMKLIVAFLVPIAFIIILGVISFREAAHGIRDNFEETASQVISMTGEYLNLGFESVENLSVEYSNSKDISNYYMDNTTASSTEQKLEAKKIKDSLQNAINAKSKTDKFISQIYYVFDDTGSITTDQILSRTLSGDVCKGYMETETGQYLNKNKSEAVWLGSDTYLDEKIGTTSSDYSLRMVRLLPTNNSLLIIDIKASVVEEVLQNKKFEKTGYMNFVTKDGKEIAADGLSETVFGDQDFYLNALASDKTSNSEYVTYKGKKYLFMYSKVGDTGAVLCALIPKATILNQADRIKKVTIIVVVVACSIAVFIAFLFSSGIDRTIKSIISDLRKAAKGDLTVKFHTKRNDEFQILNHEMQATFANMKTLVQQVNNLSKMVSESSNGLSSTSSSLLKSTGDISVAMNEIEVGVSQQAKDAEQCLLQMDNLSKKIELVTYNAKEISQIADNTKKTVADGINCAENLNRQTESTIQISTDIVNEIENLALKSQEITKISNVISNIANQTNLLSLNASIEAARAGTYGRGFAVVAEEIRNLAEQSERSVNEIKKIINSIQNNTKEAVGIARKAENVLSLQAEVVKSTTDSYQNINNSVESLVNYLKQISTNVDNIEESRVNTLASIENISAVLEEVAASSNVVNQTAGDQITSVETLNTAASTLNANADDLMQAVHRFSI